MSTKSIEKKSTLPSLVLEASELIQKIIDAEGEITEEVENALAEVEAKLSVKADSYAVIMDRFKLESDYYKEKGKELTELAKRLSNASDRMKEAIKFAMLKLKTNEIQGEDIKFKLSLSKPKLVIDEAKLPGEYKVQVVSYIPDKEKIQTALNLGDDVAGAHFETSHSLRKYAGGKK